MVQSQPAHDTLKVPASLRQGHVVAFGVDTVYWQHVCTSFCVLFLPEASCAHLQSGLWTCIGVFSSAIDSASAAMQHYAVKTLENLYTKDKLWPETLAHPSTAGRPLCIAMISVANLSLSQDNVFAF